MREKESSVQSKSHKPIPAPHVIRILILKALVSASTYWRFDGVGANIKQIPIKSYTGIITQLFH